jgi:hypothetical protein
MNSRIDTDSPEFKDLLAAWVDALKVMDTKLNVYCSAVAALENNAKYSDAATYFKQVLGNAEDDPLLRGEMDEKYRLALRRLGELSSGSHPAEAVSAWLQEYRIEKPKSL